MGGNFGDVGPRGRLEPGQGTDNFIAKPLWELPRYSITGKTKQVPWQGQVLRVQAFLQSIDTMDGVTDMWFVEDLKDWLIQGATDLEGLRAEARSQRYAAKRAENLIAHNMKFAEKKWHFANWWEVKTRPTCKACMRQGSTTKQMILLELRCPRVDEVETIHIQAQQVVFQGIQEMADKRARTLFSIATTPSLGS